jgi:hypothetical protein
MWLGFWLRHAPWFWWMFISRWFLQKLRLLVINLNVGQDLVCFIQPQKHFTKINDGLCKSRPLNIEELLSLSALQSYLKCTQWLYLKVSTMSANLLIWMLCQDSIVEGFRVYGDRYFHKSYPSSWRPFQVAINYNLNSTQAKWNHESNGSIRR